MSFLTPVCVTIPDRQWSPLTSRSLISPFWAIHLLKSTLYLKHALIQPHPIASRNQQVDSSNLSLRRSLPLSDLWRPVLYRHCFRNRKHTFDLTSPSPTSVHYHSRLKVLCGRSLPTTSHLPNHWRPSSLTTPPLHFSRGKDSGFASINTTVVVLPFASPLSTKPLLRLKTQSVRRALPWRLDPRLLLFQTLEALRSGTARVTGAVGTEASGDERDAYQGLTFQG